MNLKNKAPKTLNSAKTISIAPNDPAKKLADNLANANAHGKHPSNGENRNNFYKVPKKNLYFPKTLAIFSLPGFIILPDTYMPLYIFEEQHTDLINYSLAHERYFGILQSFGSEINNETQSKINIKTGTLAKITAFEETANGFLIMIKGIHRFKLKKLLDTNNAANNEQSFVRAKVEYNNFANDARDDKSTKNIDANQLQDFINNLNKEKILRINKKIIDKINVQQLVDSVIISHPSFSPVDKQQLIEQKTVKQRADMLFFLAQFHLKYKKLTKH